MATKDEERRFSDEAFDAAVKTASQPVKPSYAGTFDQQLSDIYDRISNREPFSYDVNADPLYQQYKDKYVTQGKLAMKDTMGQAAALTGGYGSTYGQQVGQQAYDAYLQNLGDVVPELYSMAYGRYQDQGNALRDQYNMLGQQRDVEYGRYRDELGDWNYQNELARQQEETAYNRRIAEDNTAYSRRQNAYANLYALIRASGYSPTENELAEAGMTREAANALINEYQRSITPAVAVASGGTSGGGGGRSGGGGSGGGGSGGGGRSGSGTPKTDTGDGNWVKDATKAIASVPGIVSNAASTAAKIIGQSKNSWGFRDVAGVAQNLAAATEKPISIANYLSQEVKAGSITDDEKRYIQKNLQVKDRM